MRGMGVPLPEGARDAGEFYSGEESEANSVGLPGRWEFGRGCSSKLVQSTWRKLWLMNLRTRDAFEHSGDTGRADCALREIRERFAGSGPGAVAGRAW